MTDSEPGSRDTRSLRMRLVCLAALLVVAVVQGGRTATIPEELNTGPALLLIPILMGLFASAWCLFDGRARGKPPASVALMVIFLFFPIGLPVYCIWSRGLRGVLVGVGVVVCFVLAMLGGMVITSVALGIPIPE